MILLRPPRGGGVTAWDQLTWAFCVVFGIHAALFLCAPLLRLAAQAIT